MGCIAWQEMRFSSGPAGRHECYSQIVRSIVYLHANNEQPQKPPALTSASALRILLVLAIGIGVLNFLRAPYRHSGGESGFAWSSGSACPAEGSTPEEHGAADYNWQLQAVGGEESALHRFRSQVVFVNLWATWCGPCRDEMPSIQALYETMNKEGVAFVLVSEEEEYTVREFMQRNSYTVPVFVSRQEVPDVFASRGIPATYIVDRAGKVRMRRVGSADWNSPACQGYLRSLLQQPAAFTEEEPRNRRAALAETPTH